MVLVNIKWNKQTFENIDLDPSAGAVGFKSLVARLTGVPNDRQKLMAKGCWSGTLKDDVDFGAISFKPGQQIVLMGTADVVIAPQETIKFVEDMTDNQKAEIGIVISAGLNNLQNTCYMNSTVQCLRFMPELRSVIRDVTPTSADLPATELTVALKNTFDRLDSSAVSISPVEFVLRLRGHFPQFAERGEQGGYMQQDAEEFYAAVSQCLSRGASSIGRDYSSILGIELEERLTCQETDLEPSITKIEAANKVVCNIQGSTQGTKAMSVDHLHDGLKLWMVGTIEKHSDVLGRNAIWNKTVRIAKLPQYLCIQFMRFFWKATPENADRAGTKCKILRTVSFTEASLRVNRENKIKAGSVLNIKEDSSPEAASSNIEDEMIIDSDDAAELQAALALSLGESVPEATVSNVSFGEGFPADFTGQYELHSIVSHKGRSADSGHYIGWVRQAPGSSAWWKFNDNVVTETTMEEILMLKGGADRDSAYLAFYRVKNMS